MGKTITLPTLKKQYELACNEYIVKFSKKQDLDFDDWIGGVGEIASFATQYFFSLSEIIIDLHTKQPKGFILEWQSDGVDYNMGMAFPHYINYKSYTHGLRYKNL